ncbi:hypothetical protein EDD36DRAFT_473920 [Exophiala viscosa]|uniref:Uncharacterized protein n=1 Tax=Exophiala viscosa TaxID=2486360 RepID=A0AAN6IDZ0_9EURO|nr:hypothetical protein EDD36DRAFT_473920 [Exophiala viscosa]
MDESTVNADGRPPKDSDPNGSNSGSQLLPEADHAVAPLLPDGDDRRSISRPVDSGPRRAVNPLRGSGDQQAAINPVESVKLSAPGVEQSRVRHENETGLKVPTEAPRTTEDPAGSSAGSPVQTKAWEDWLDDFNDTPFNSDKPSRMMVQDAEGTGGGHEKVRSDFIRGPVEAAQFIMEQDLADLFNKHGFNLQDVNDSYVVEQYRTGVLNIRDSTQDIWHSGTVRQLIEKIRSESWSKNSSGAVADSKSESLLAKTPNATNGKVEQSGQSPYSGPTWSTPQTFFRDFERWQGQSQRGSASRDRTLDPEGAARTFVRDDRAGHLDSDVANPLYNNPAFESLLLDMQVLVIPSELCILAQTLLTIPKDDVRFHHEYESTFGNKCKKFVDEVTNVDWNWWPLSPTIPPLPEGRVRICWKCLLSNHNAVEKSYGKMFRKSRQICCTDCCLFEDRRHVATICVRQHSDVAVKLWRLTHQRLTQVGGIVSSSASPSPGSSLGSRSASPASSTDATSVGSASHMYVLLGISGMRSTLELKHMNVIKDTNTEAKFFRKLNDLYRSARGFLRIWLSIWRLRHCEFVKIDWQFRKFRPNRVIELCRDLPEDKLEYTYSPCPPQITVSAPGITRHMWQHALRPCDRRMMGLALGFCASGWFHDCVESLNPGSTEYIVRLPKKHSEWLIDTEGIDDAFGILTKEEPSILYVLVYHIVILAGPFAFWAWTMPREGRQDGSWNLQDPSVPVTVVLALLSLFWALARPLKLFRDPQE